MSLSPEQVRRAAQLARIALEPEESGALTGRLNRVLAMIDQLQAVDTRGVEPMAHPLDAALGLAQRLRADEVTEPDRREACQAGAPAVEDGLYLVPRVIE